MQVDDGWLYQRRRQPVGLVDKVPLVVPPAAAKSQYYANLGLRAQWAEAADALSRAEELVVMGYSIPANDELARSLLLTNLHPDATVHSVDKGTESCNRLADMFGDTRIVPTLAGREDAVEGFVELYCQHPDEG